MTEPVVLLVATPLSYRLSAYLAAARAASVEPLVVSNSPASLVREVAEGVRVDFSAPAAALEVVRERIGEQAVIGVVATDDAAVELAAHLSAGFGVPGNRPEAARLTRRKDLARQRLRVAGVEVPDHRVIDLDQPLPSQLQALQYPQVLKPLALSASTGVMRVDSLQQAEQACRRIAAIISDRSGDEGRLVLAESYIDGIEVAYEGLLQSGRLQRLALFDKPEPLVGPCFEETYYVTPSRLDESLQARIESTVAAACAAYGLHQGSVHAELRIDAQGGCWILEVAARTIGGDCSRTLDRLLELPLERYVLELALGRELAIGFRSGASGVLMIPIPAAGVLRRVEGEEEAARVPGVDQLTIAVEPGQVIRQLPEASSYLGFITASGETPEAVEQSLRQAHERLRFVIDPLLNLV